MQSDNRICFRSCLRRYESYAIESCLCIVVLIVALSPVGIEAAGLQPPCGTKPLPGYADLTAPPNIGVWKQEDAGSRWVPPACTGWGSSRFDVVVAVAGRFRGEDNVDMLLPRFGEVSRLAGVRYWSVSKKRWQDLITEARALDGPNGKRPRADFSLDEMKAERDLYFRLRNGGSGSVIYRMRVRELAAKRLVLETENTTALRLLALPLFKPRDLQSLYFFDWSSPGVWDYFSLTGIRQGVTLPKANESSYINRAVAIFRKVAGIPADQEPPAAP
jgi:hypothetical protein